MSFFAFHVVFEQVVIDSVCISMLDCFILISSISTIFSRCCFCDQMKLGSSSNKKVLGSKKPVSSLAAISGHSITGILVWLLYVFSFLFLSVVSVFSGGAVLVGMSSCW